MVTLDRRTFLKLAGATATAGALYRLGLVGLETLAARQSPSLPGSLAGRHLLGTCRLCVGGCGLSARVVDGQLIKLDGNPFHPNNQGRLCPKGQAGLQALYDPDRIKMPMRRVEGGWQQVSWDEALAEIAEALSALRDAGHPERFAFLHDGKRGATRDLIARFCQAFGTPNDVPRPTFSADGTPLAHRLGLGWSDHAAYDWENTNYLLCFGGALLEAWQPLVRHLRAYSRMRRGRPNVRAKIVQVESRASVTATKADEWIPIHPGTEGALALGMAHVIIRDGIYDAEFIQQHTTGFEDWTDAAGESRPGFRKLVLRDYSPDKMAGITGVPVETIERLARDFAAAKPSVAAGDVGGYTNSLHSQWAINVLNALVGTIDVPGGVMRQIEPPLADWPAPVLDEVARRGLAQPRLDQAGSATFPLADSVPHGLAAAADSVDVLFLYHANPVYEDPPALGWAAALDRIPLVVSFSPYLDETAEHADLLLPDCTYLEKWFLDPIEPSLGYPVVGLGRPVVDPLYDTRNLSDVLIGLARSLGGSVAESLPWDGFLMAIRERVRGLYQVGTGMPSGAAAETFDQFWADFQARGVWYDQPYTFGEWERVLTTPSGRFEFRSQFLEERLGALGVSFSREELFPRYQGPILAGEGKIRHGYGDEDEDDDDDDDVYPFVLHTFKPVTYTERWSGNLSWMLDNYGLHVHGKWGSWVELNPEVAHALGIHDGDPVVVESPVGRIELPARLWPGTPHYVVSIPVGQGHTAGGRWVEQRGANPSQITALLMDPLTGELAMQSTRVRVRKARGRG